VLINECLFLRGRLSVYQELLTIKKEQRNLESEINAIKFQNKKQSIKPRYRFYKKWHDFKKLK
jgi:hypothetical protein